MQIREVHAGDSGVPDDVEFVELQMYAAGQTLFDDAEAGLVFYGPAGSLVDAISIPNVANGQNQRTALIGTAAAAAEYDVALDHTYVSAFGVMNPSAGAVCLYSPAFGDIDCAAWGTVLGAPSGAGTPAVGMGSEQSLERSIAPGCATLLEAGDDSNDSATDFALQTTPSPRPNSVAPTEGPCANPQTTITKHPANRTAKRRATFAFKSSINPATFRCSLDGGAAKPCASPKTYKRLRPGKHTFKVRANADGQTDQSPDAFTWKVRQD